MPLYHIGCCPINATIYAGTINREGDLWVSQSDATEEALAAVRDHLMIKALGENSSYYGYEWTKKDGTVVELSVKIKPPKEGSPDA